MPEDFIVPCIKETNGGVAVDVSRRRGRHCAEAVDANAKNKANSCRDVETRLLYP